MIFLVLSYIVCWVHVSFVCLLVGLLDLSNAYCENTLKKHCEQIIKKGITIDNVAMLYAAAIKYDAKVNTCFGNKCDCFDTI